MKKLFYLLLLLSNIDNTFNSTSNTVPIISIVIYPNVQSKVKTNINLTLNLITTSTITTISTFNTNSNLTSIISIILTTIITYNIITLSEAIGDVLSISNLNPTNVSSNVTANVSEPNMNSQI